jgi:hypothetical protein
MKTLILAASIAPAFAAETTAPQQTAMATDAQQKHTYSAMSDEGSSRGAIATRNARMQRNEMERSQNARNAWAGSAHYY